MTEKAHANNLLEHCLRSVAELAHQLRHLSAGPTGDSPLPPSLPRLKVAAQMLATTKSVPGVGPLLPLAEQVLDLIAVIHDCPGRDLSYLEGALEELTRALENSFSDMDQGLTMAELAAHPRWLETASWLETAGTPMEVMNELDRCVRSWEDTWCERNLPHVQENDLKRRWQTFRDYGDAMFGFTGRAQENEMVQDGCPGEVVLLLGSQLQREQLARKLKKMGHQVQVVNQSRDLPLLMAESGPVVAVICDNVEPTNHLAWLVAWRQNSQHKGLRLIMVASGTGSRADKLRRAGNLGADGVWFEPFTNNPLQN